MISLRETSENPPREKFTGKEFDSDVAGAQIELNIELHEAEVTHYTWGLFELVFLDGSSYVEKMDINGSLLYVHKTVLLWLNWQSSDC